MALSSEISGSRGEGLEGGLALFLVREASMLGTKDSSRLRISAGMVVACFLDE